MKKKSPADKQSYGVYVRLTPVEGKKLARIARQQKCSVAYVVRDALKALYVI